jgi:4-amino-4-deoxy-L-arabinose transferase-like glycosyltransferase
MLRRFTDDRLALLGLGFVYTLFVGIIATAWNGALTMAWHPGIHLEQTSVAINHAQHGLFIPYSIIQADLLHLPPLYTWFTYGAIELTGWTEAGRLVSLLAGLSTLAVLFAILEEFDFDRDIRLGALVFLATSPLFLLLSGAIMQETLMLFFSTLAMYVFARYVRTGDERYLLATSLPIFLSSFSKWPGIFTLIPIALFLSWDERWRIFRHWQAYLVAIIPVSLSLLWFFYLSSVSTSPPSGNIAIRLLFNVQTSPVTTVVRLTRYWMTRLPGTHLLLALVALGSFRRFDEREVFFVSWLAGGVLYVVVFLAGAVFHDHYSALMLPPLAVLAAWGLRTLLTHIESRLPSITSQQLTAVVWVLLLVGVLVGVATLSTTVQTESEYVVDRNDVGAFSVSGLGSRDTALVVFPDTDKQSYAREVDDVAAYVNDRPSSHVGIVGRASFQVYYGLSGNLTQVEMYSVLSGRFENDSTPPDVLVVPKQDDLNTTIPGYAQDREFTRFRVYRRNASN